MKTLLLLGIAVISLAFGGCTSTGGGHSHGDGGSCCSDTGTCCR